jgi:hypothetical protein
LSLAPGGDDRAGSGGRCDVIFGDHLVGDATDDALGDIGLPGSHHQQKANGEQPEDSPKTWRARDGWTFIHGDLPFGRWWQGAQHQRAQGSGLESLLGVWSSC